MLRNGSSKGWYSSVCFALDLAGIILDANTKVYSGKVEIEQGKVWPQVLAIFIGCIGAISNGLFIAWPSPFTVVISQDKENYDITEEEAAYFTIIPPIGLIVGSLLFFKLNDVIGRKKSLLLLAVPHILSWILVLFARDIYTFYASRFITGFGDAALFITFPMYIGEISTPKVRGSWGNAMPFFMYGGQCTMNIVGSYYGVLETTYMFIGLPIIFVVFFSLMPESPYYCTMKGDEEGAKESLRFLRRKKDVEAEYLLLKADVDRQMSESGSWKDLVTIKSNRKALIAGIFLRMAQQMAGISVFASLIQYIFFKAGGSISPETSSIIFSALCWFMVFIAGMLVDKLGRRKAFIASALSSGVILIIEAVYFYLDQIVDSIDMSFVNWIPLAGMLMFIFCFVLGLGIIPTLMLGELFSASIKVKGLCVLTIVFGFGVFISTNIFNLLNTYVGLYGPFLVFGVSCFVSSVVTVYVVPETKGKTLEEIQQELKGNKCDKKKLSVC